MTEVTDRLDAPEKETRGRSLDRIALLLLFTGILLFLSWLGWKAWRIYRTSSSLLARQAEIQQLADGGWQQINPDAAETLVLNLRADIVALKQDIGFLIPVLPYLSQLPDIGPLAESAPHLLEMADAGSEAAAYGIRGLKPVLDDIQTEDGSESVVPILLEAVDAARPDLASTVLALERVAVARKQIADVEALPWRIRMLIEKGDDWLSIGQDFTRISLALPELMGVNGPRRYLILAQNQDELRPTGGFISGVGYLEIENGEIIGLDFIDANIIDAWEDPGKIGGGLVKAYDVPPQPLQDFMLLDLFLFRDSNFWPDFALSGQKAMDFYAYGRDVQPLDGVIGINQQFLQLLLNGMGPVTIPETGEIVDSSNVIPRLQEAWTLQDGVTERKAFLAPFAAAILARVELGLNDIDPLHLIQQLNQALDQKDLQIYVREPGAAALLAANNWDGRLIRPESNDALMIVDTNMGYNKANFFIDRAATYDVQLAKEGDSEAVLEVTHIHQGQKSDEVCWQGSQDVYIEGASYPALTDKCYWNFLRIYVPEGSQLLSGPQHQIPGQTWFGGYDWQPETETVSEIPGYTTFASWMLLPRGEEITSKYRYSLPQSVIQTEDGVSTYIVQLLRQAGTRPHPVQVSLTPPPGKTVVGVSPEPTAQENGTYIFEIELDSDQTVSLVYR